MPATMPPYPPPRNLRDLLRAEPRLDPARADRLLGDLAAALAPRHARGEAHGALTPEHVLLDADGGATPAPPPPDDDGAPAPWPAYLAPEQLDGRPGDARSDVYALGLLGWEMLAGQTPWAGESLYSVVLKQREQDLPRLSTLRPGLPRPLVRAIEGALHKHPGDRWQDAGELLAELRGDARGLTAETPTVEAPRLAPRRADAPPPPEPPQEPPQARPVAPATRSSRLPALGLAALAVAVLGAGGAAVAVMQGRQESTTTKAWLDSLGSAQSGEVVAESTLTVAEEQARDRARRDSLQRRELQLAAAARRDSLRRVSEDSARAADSLAAAVPAPVDSSTAPPDTTTVPPDTVGRAVRRR